MKIFKVINNNIVITLDQNNQEIILMGRGLGFKQRPGNNIDENLIEDLITPKTKAIIR